MDDSDVKTLRIRSTDLATCEFEDQTLVLDLRSSTYLSLNGSATRLWRRLQDGCSRDALIDALRDEFDIEPEMAERDVDKFLAECHRRDLLES